MKINNPKINDYIESTDPFDNFVESYLHLHGCGRAFRLIQGKSNGKNDNYKKVSEKLSFVNIIGNIVRIASYILFPLPLIMLLLREQHRHAKGIPVQSKAKWSALKNEAKAEGHLLKKLSKSAPSWVAKTAFNKCSDFFHQLFRIKQLDKTKVILSDVKISPSEREWMLNKALLKDAYKATNNKELQNRIKFMSTNYLSAAAPTPILVTKMLFPGAERNFQVNPQSNFFVKRTQYHRHEFMNTLHWGSTINRAFAMNNNLPFFDNSPLIPTDTDEFEDFLPISFTLLNEGNQNEWKTIIKEKMKAHLQSNPTKKLRKPLPQSFLFDMTQTLKDWIQTDQNKIKEQAFTEQYEKVKGEIVKTVKDVVHELKDELHIPQSKLEKFVRKNTTTICRVKLDEIDLAGIKILPILAPLNGEQLYNTHPAFLDFVAETGLFIGALTMRRHLVDFFKEGKGVDYAIDKGNKNCIFYENKKSFINSALFVRLTNNMKTEDYQKEYPHVAVMMQSVLKILSGLFNEITDDQWQSLNQEGATRQILQTSLFKLREYIASAELHAKTDYAQFAKFIDLAYAEIAVLLELTRPFKPKEFSEIYKQNLQIVPDELNKHVIAGLGKTGVNLFAAVNTAIQNNNPRPTRVYGKGLYFEQADFIGNNHKVEDVLKNPQKAKKVDLYACQFNPNIDIETDHIHYEVPHIAQDITTLLKDRKENDPPLTVAVDSTIDFINSNKIKELLEQFRGEIANGKLNFVFFRSGLKFDMLGTDFYYGAPFFMVNNGDSKWDPFKTVLQSKASQTDTLSQQWFCISNKYALAELERYRKLIFDNTREILNQCPKNLKGASHRFSVASAEDKMDACFIDIKVKRWLHQIKATSLLGRYILKCEEKKIKNNTRASFGFSYSNIIKIAVQEVEDSTSLRLNPGINPKENKVIIDFLNELSKEQR